MGVVLGSSLKDLYEYYTFSKTEPSLKENGWNFCLSKVWQRYPEHYMFQNFNFMLAGHMSKRVYVCRHFITYGHHYYCYNYNYLVCEIYKMGDIHS